MSFGRPKGTARPPKFTNVISEDLTDPALGGKVPRCLSCGMPTGLMTGTFTPDRDQSFAGRRFRYRLCIRCIERVNGPMDPDPLHVGI